MASVLVDPGWRLPWWYPTSDSFSISRRRKDLVIYGFVLNLYNSFALFEANRSNLEAERLVVFPVVHWHEVYNRQRIQLLGLQLKHSFAFGLSALKVTQKNCDNKYILKSVLHYSDNVCWTHSLHILAMNYSGMWGR